MSNSNITSCDSWSFSTENTGEDAAAAAVNHQQLEMLPQNHSPNSNTSTTTNNSNASNTNSQPPLKKKRNLPGNPDPNAEVVALSPNTLVATNRFVCEICNKGFQRDQNLQLHRRGHNLPWKLKLRTTTEVKKRVYVCPEPSCVHHNPARALGDLTGIKKHFSRKHGEKKWKCEKCSKKYAVHSDWKAHSKICGTKEYKCDCGTIFSRRDSFITHRAFCDALSDDSNKFNEAGQLQSIMHASNLQPPMIPNLAASLQINTNNHKQPLQLPHDLIAAIPAKPFTSNMAALPRSLSSTSSLSQLCSNSPHINMFEEKPQTNMSATALLQKAAQMGATVNSNSNSMMTDTGFATSMAPPSYGVMNQHIHHGQQDLSQYNFHANGSVMMDGVGNGMGGMSGLDMFNAILDQSKALSKIIEQNNRSSCSGVLHAMNNGRSSSIDVGGAKGSEDVMTLDLLGIGGGVGGGGGGGGGGDGSFFGGEQSELKIEYGEMSQIRIQALNHFQQQTAAYEN